MGVVTGSVGVARLPAAGGGVVAPADPATGADDAAAAGAEAPAAGVGADDPAAAAAPASEVVGAAAAGSPASLGAASAASLGSTPASLAAAVAFFPVLVLVGGVALSGASSALASSTRMLSPGFVLKRQPAPSVNMSMQLTAAHVRDLLNERV